VPFKPLETAVTRCNYCGRDNDLGAEACSGCGTPIPVPPTLDSLIAASTYAAPPVIDPPQLTAGRAALILLLTCVAQVIGSALVTVIAFVLKVIGGADLQKPDQIAEITQAVQPAALVCAAVLGIIVMLGSALLLVRRELNERSPVGAAWAFGSWKNIAAGFGLGLVTAVIFSAIVAPFAHSLHPKLGPITSMGLTRGAAQLAWISLALFFAPAPEELLFRGVMYGGFRRSFGSAKAAILVTGIFVLLHITEWSRFPPAVLGITGLGLLTLWLRLRTSAIGPAIAAHLGYNGIIVLNTVLFTLFNLDK
jgi:membrane protease YdiL (CAAX protease family)